MISDKGNVTSPVLLDLSAILLEKAENLVGVTGITLSWSGSDLADDNQFVNVLSDPFVYTKLKYSVPQGSVLGLLIFTLNVLPLGSVISKWDTDKFQRLRKKTLKTVCQVTFSYSTWTKQRFFFLFYKLLETNFLI